MEIGNPKRVLAVCLEGSTVHLTRVITELTGTSPQQTSTSLAGTTHDLRIETQYYKATVPIWLDLIESPEEWAESFLSPEAKEVLEVLGGLIVVFALPPTSSLASSTATTSTTSAQPETITSSKEPNPSPTPTPPSVTQTRELITQIGRVVSEGLGGWTWEGVSLCLGVGENDDVDEWEEVAAGAGMEFVQIKKGKVVGRNEFGEKTGIPRVLEALEANEWAGDEEDGMKDYKKFNPDFLDDSDFADSGDDSDGLDGSGKLTGAKKDAVIDPENLDFGFDRSDFEGMKAAIWSSGQEADVEVDGADAATAANGGAKTQGTDEKIDDEEVQKIEKMMMKLSAVRDMAAGLPEDQRRKMAAKAVNEVMKEL